MGSQRVGHDWATELNWTEWMTGNACLLRSKILFIVLTHLSASAELLAVNLEFLYPLKYLDFYIFNFYYQNCLLIIILYLITIIIYLCSFAFNPWLFINTIVFINIIYEHIWNIVFMNTNNGQGNVNNLINERPCFIKER